MDTMTSLSENASISQPLAMLCELLETMKTALGSVSANDAINGCPDSVIPGVREEPSAVMTIAHDHLHSKAYSEVRESWRRAFEEASLWKVVSILEEGCEVPYEQCTFQGQEHTNTECDSYKQLLKENPFLLRGEFDFPDTYVGTFGDWMSRVTRILDIALILTGGPGRRDLIFTIFDVLREVLEGIEDADYEFTMAQIAPFHPAPPTPPFKQTFDRTGRLDLTEFQEHLDKRGTPLILTGALDEWPALTDPQRKWSDPAYLLKGTLGGRRYVPVEIGRSYTDEGWGQKIMPFANYMNWYLLLNSSEQKGYLAQHDLFDQIPSFAADTLTPDYCFTNPPSATVSGLTPQPELDEPLRNAWLGPAGTISPLHTDPYHNILCQIVGSKYIRLYPPSQTSKLYPRGLDETGVSMENTSHVDVSLARKLYKNSEDENAEARLSSNNETDQEGLEDIKKQRSMMEQEFPLFKDAEYIEGVLGPGECLYIPLGWWHYVESLSTSFSVSYWFN